MFIPGKVAKVFTKTYVKVLLSRAEFEQLAKAKKTNFLRLVFDYGHYDISALTGVISGTSRTMTLDSSGVGLMPLGSSDTKKIMVKLRINDIRIKQQNVFAANLISTDNPSSLVESVSATSANLFTISWSRKPSVGGTSQTDRFRCNVFNTQPYKSDIHSCYLSVCFLNKSRRILLILHQILVIYIKACNALNDVFANYDMPIFMKSNATPIGFGLQLINATNATSTNSAYFGTTTITSTGRVGIGTGSLNK
ncbi:hypothetical protein Plhal304r1_c012g0044941 [Plasmopara halstedii]